MASPRALRSVYDYLDASCAFVGDHGDVCPCVDAPRPSVRPCSWRSASIRLDHGYDHSFPASSSRGPGVLLCREQGGVGGRTSPNAATMRGTARAQVLTLAVRVQQFKRTPRSFPRNRID